MHEIFSTELNDGAAARECAGLAEQVSEALAKYATANRAKYGEVYAYEVDGFGNQLFQDDANVPSLLSLPYLGCCRPDDPLYLRHAEVRPERRQSVLLSRQGRGGSGRSRTPGWT